MYVQSHYVLLNGRVNSSSLPIYLHELNRSDIDLDGHYLRSLSTIKSPLERLHKLPNILRV